MPNARWEPMARYAGGVARTVLLIGGVMLFARLAAFSTRSPPPAKLELAGVTVTPHLRLETMRYRREPEPACSSTRRTMTRISSSW